MKIIISPFLIILMAFSASLDATNIAITIADYPLPDGQLFTVKERTQKFIAACAQHNCKVVFFCVGDHCNARKDNSLFEALLQSGNFIANHSMTHFFLSSSSTSLAQFEQEIIATQDLLSSYDNYKKWFRYPYLDYGHNIKSGGSIEKLLKALEILNTLEYAEGYVTINTFDWYINKKLREAIKQQKKIDYKRLGKLYIALLEEWIEHYIHLYKQVINQDITHTLLLHDNDLNARYLPDILTMIKKRGWNLVSPEIAFQDTSWRKILLEKEDLIRVKPASLNGNEIDKRLASTGIID